MKHMVKYRSIQYYATAGIRGISDKVVNMCFYFHGYVIIIALSPIKQPGPYCERPSASPLQGVEPIQRLQSVFRCQTCESTRHLRTLSLMFNQVLHTSWTLCFPTVYTSDPFLRLTIRPP